MFAANQSQILAILSDSPQREFYLSELGEMLGKHPGVFQRGLNSLVVQGLVISRKRGGQRLFIMNTAHPLYKEIKAVVLKTAGVEAQLGKFAASDDRITLAVIYGSYAHGSPRQDSDIDLLLIVNDLKVEDVLVKELGRVEKVLGRDVNYKIYEDRDFKTRMKKKDPFLTEVFSRKYIVLKGAV